MEHSIKPTGDEKFMLYVLPMFFIGMAVFVSYLLGIDSVSAIMSVPFLLMAVLIYLKQRNNLKRTKLDVSGSSENFNKCVVLANELEWEVLESKQDEYIIAQTKRSWTSWGELVTINFEDDAVWLNSRPSPYKKSSLITLGKNKKNLALIKSVLQGS